MVCDAMTKGTLSREPLLALWRAATLRIIGETPIVWRSNMTIRQKVEEKDFDHVAVPRGVSWADLRDNDQ